MRVLVTSSEGFLGKHLIKRLLENDHIAIGKQVEIRHVPERAGQIFRSVIDNNPLRGPGWKPKWNLNDGLRNCAEINKLEGHNS